MVTERKGNVDGWLQAQIEVAANNWQMLDRIQGRLMRGKLTYVEEGCRQQDKMVVNPLLCYYDKLQRTLLMQFEALGLNYKSNPTRVNAAKPKADEIENYLNTI